MGFASPPFLLRAICQSPRVVVPAQWTGWHLSTWAQVSPDSPRCLWHCLSPCHSFTMTDNHMFIPLQMYSFPTLFVFKAVCIFLSKKARKNYLYRYLCTSETHILNWVTIVPILFISAVSQLSLGFVWQGSRNLRTNSSGTLSSFCTRLRDVFQHLITRWQWPSQIPDQWATAFQSKQAVVSSLLLTKKTPAGAFCPDCSDRLHQSGQPYSQRN